MWAFPGETDELFLETYNFLNELDISYLHVFTYSERDNTEAVDMEGVVPGNIRAKRSKMLRGLSVKKRRAFYESQIGANRTVLFEGENKEGYIHGFTENYVKVKTPWNPELVNTLHDVNLTKIDEEGSVSNGVCKSICLKYLLKNLKFLKFEIFYSLIPGGSKLL